jgi:probable F420-dependent oxidoreductase
VETTIETTRRALGPIGASLPVSFNSVAHAQQQREAAVRLERAGYQSLWTNEVIGKDALVQLAVLLSATDRMAFGTFIANIWARPAQTMHAAAAQLAQAYPGRFVLGLGVGYPAQAESVGQEFGRPLATMRDYLHSMESPTWPPAPDTPYARLVAANGPKMLALAGELTDGAIPAGLPAEYTAGARQILGPDKLLVVGLSVVPDTDADRAKEIARQDVRNRLSAPSFAARMTELDYSDQEIGDVSDRLVDALVAHGDPAAIADRVGEHLSAGADHVVLMQPIGADFAASVGQFEQLAPAMAGSGS